MPVSRPDPAVVDIPVDKPVNLNTLVTQHHLNTQGYNGSLGPTVIMDDANGITNAGERWIFSQVGANTYTIRNAETAYKRYLASVADGRGALSVHLVDVPDGASAARWSVRPNPLFATGFSLHPEGRPDLAVSEGFSKPSVGAGFVLVRHDAGVGEVGPVRP
ncbi:hypothetical protein DIZ27_40860 [Streptomyces sp. NWU339]|uniref:RICIN domain-containing protein n=1 Tax=Streptomyces sp. NWU339 TaxID=2185284 RepID=UPI000D676EF9|nr:hypothetical protein [Streptomyces sp. NWU339]PWI05183.1 hypothetical protein DIZ27_40860 [Streptomyces sp. NWU339]